MKKDKSNDFYLIANIKGATEMQAKLEQSLKLKIEVTCTESKTLNTVTYNILSPTGIKIGWVTGNSNGKWNTSCISLKKLINGLLK